MRGALLVERYSLVSSADELPFTKVALRLRLRLQLRLRVQAGEVRSCYVPEKRVA